MTCIPDRTSLQASFYTPPDIPRQELSSTEVPSSFYDQIFAQTSCRNQTVTLSCLEPSNLNCQGKKHFPDYGGSDLCLPFTLSWWAV